MNVHKRVSPSWISRSMIEMEQRIWKNRVDKNWEPDLERNRGAIRCFELSPLQSKYNKHIEKNEFVPLVEHAKEKERTRWRLFLIHSEGRLFLEETPIVKPTLTKKKELLDLATNDKDPSFKNSSRHRYCSFGTIPITLLNVVQWNRGGIYSFPRIRAIFVWHARIVSKGLITLDNDVLRSCVASQPIRFKAQHEINLAQDVRDWAPIYSEREPCATFLPTFFTASFCNKRDLQPLTYVRKITPSSNVPSHSLRAGLLEA